MKKSILMLAGASKPAESMRYIKAIDTHFNGLEKEIMQLEQENQGLKEAMHELAKEVTIEKISRTLG